ncbi:ABC transporter permease [Segeticoccus rhizosphaerae]|uniref:ABC transporter permease n=1 Tax=Segeticoccus rhizosphaerae TaxID=1104777 RepID=UPI00193A68CA|nr:ABC transporter permease [Segeticoccus rhizosphaerae]
MINQIIDWLTDPAHWSGTEGIVHRLVQHLEYSAISLVIAALIALPLGMYIGHTGKGTFLIAGIANSFRALPSLGLLTLIVLVMSGSLPFSIAYLLPTVIVLVLLAIPPILTNTYAGIQNVDAEARDAAYGMGMTGGQVLTQVETPCALPLIISGIRSAALQIIATATVAAYVSLGGLGRFVIDGLAQQDFPQMAAGAVLVAVLALLVDLVLIAVQRFVVSRGLTGRYARTTASSDVIEAESVNTLSTAR